MSGNVDKGDAWPKTVAMQFVNKTKEEVGSNEDCTTNSTNANLTEHDYIGLCLPSSTAHQNTQTIFSHRNLSVAKTYAKAEEFECRDTELRLGIGPLCDVDESPVLTNTVRSMPLATRQLIKQCDPGSDKPHHPREDALVNAAMEFHQSFWPWVAPGRFMIPVPKVSMVPAKRPFMEVVGESGDNNIASTYTIPGAGGSQLPMVASSLQGGLYTWSHNSSSASNWQQSACANPNHPDASAPLAFANRSLTPPPNFKRPPTPPSSHFNTPPPATPAPSTVARHSSIPSSNGLVSLNGQVDARMSKAPVVGWPPVRSYRKNTLNSTVGANKASNASSDVQKLEDSNTNPPEAVVGEQSKGSIKDTLFVKVKLDGVRICRKVDLTSYNSYDSLKSALQEMFQGFVCNENAKLDLLQGKNYVLTHEDKDGDWMLVGDVPWHMFVTTVKSFRIMKAVDAVGLGEKVFAKLKAQGNISQGKGGERALQSVH